MVSDATVIFDEMEVMIDGNNKEVTSEKRSEDRD